MLNDFYFHFPPQKNGEAMTKSIFDPIFSWGRIFFFRHSGGRLIFSHKLIFFRRTVS